MEQKKFQNEEIQKQTQKNIFIHQILEFGNLGEKSKVGTL